MRTVVRTLVLLAMLGLAAVPTAAASSPAPSAGDVGQYIVVLEPDASSAVVAHDLAAAHGGQVEQVYRNVVNGFTLRVPAVAATAIARNPNVRAVVEDGTVQLAGDSAGMGIFRIDAHLSQSTANGYRGAGVRIAVIDSGVDVDHPDLAPNLDLANAVNCDSSASTIDDPNGHGTHVSGIAAAARNDLGIAGVAPEATILPLRAFDADGFANDSEILCAMDHLAGVVAADGVRTALNMSFVDTGSDSVCDDADVSDVLHEAVCDLHDMGVVMVAGAGNSGVNIANQVPARWDEVIAVSALTDFDGAPGGAAGCITDFFEFGHQCDDQFTTFSNHGALVDVIAPGVRIYSTVVGGWDTKSGTSMAAPHVTGLVAVMLAEDPSLTLAEIRHLLKSTGECPNGTVNSDGGTCAGSGQWTGDPDGIPEPLVNALRAAQAADAGAPTNLPPTAAFGASCADLTCTFTDASTDVDGTVVSWIWDFGDGTTSTQRHPVHTYGQAGTFTVTLTVTDDLGAADVASAPVNPTDQPVGNEPPVADAGLDQAVPDTRKKGTEAVDLDGSGSADPDGSIASYTWLDESGTVLATGAQPTVTLPAGSSTLELVVVDDAGAEGRDTVTIMVGDAPANTPPVADAGPDRTVMSDGSPTTAVQLDGSGSTDVEGPVVTYEWRDGAGTLLGSGPTPVVDLPLGINEITLTVTDEQGATDTDSVVITVDLPIAWTSHVHDIDATTASLRGGKWSATVDVYVVFSELELLGQILGADPTTVTWTTSTGETLSCTTAAAPDQSTDGRCSVTITVPKKVESVTVAVESVWTPGFLYDPGANHDADGDSDGTTIVVTRP